LCGLFMGLNGMGLGWCRLLGGIGSVWKRCWLSGGGVS